MARSYYDVINSQKHAGSVGNPKTILQVTAPSAAALAIPRIEVAGDGTSGSAAKMLVELVRGASGGEGTSVSPVAHQDNNPAGVSGPTAKENFSTEPTGGTVIYRSVLAPYTAWTLPIGEIVLKPSETLGVRINAGAAVSVTVNMPKVEV